MFTDLYVLNAAIKRHCCAVLLVAATMLLTACGGGGAVTPPPVAVPAPIPVPPPAPDVVEPVGPPPLFGTEAVRVGLLLPLSGPHRTVGEAMLEAAQLALFDIGERRLVLVPQDTKGTADGAAAAAQQAIDDGASMMLGPVFADSIRGAKPVAQDYAVPLVGFSTDRSVAGGGVYIMGFTPQEQIDRVVAFAVADGRTQVAALLPETAYGATIRQALQRSLAQRGGALVHVETYENNADSLIEAVGRLAMYSQSSLAQDYQALVLPAGGALLRRVAPLLPSYGIDPARVRLLGTGLWDDPDLRRIAALHGAWYAGPAPETSKMFYRHFASAYRVRPPRVASLAYDGVALAAALVAKNPDRPFTNQAIRNWHGFAGIDGLFRFNLDGVAERGLAVIEFTPRGVVSRDPPPSAFDRRVAKPVP